MCKIPDLDDSSWFASVDICRSVAWRMVRGSLRDCDQIAAAHVSQRGTFTLRAAVQLCTEERHRHAGMRAHSHTCTHMLTQSILLFIVHCCYFRRSWMICAAPSSTCWILLLRCLLSSTNWTLPCPHICCLFTDWNTWGTPARLHRIYIDLCVCVSLMISDKNCIMLIRLCFCLLGCSVLWTLTVFRSCFDTLRTERYRKINLVSRRHYTFQKKNMCFYFFIMHFNIWYILSRHDAVCDCR